MEREKDGGSKGRKDMVYMRHVLINFKKTLESTESLYLPCINCIILTENLLLCLE